MNTEHIVAKVNDLVDGEMKEIQVDDVAVLLVRHKSRFYAYWPTCPHHGAPLAEGRCDEGHIRCPWHQAVFDTETGALRQPPAMDVLSHYELRVDGDDVVVSVPDVMPESCAPEMVSHDPDADGRRFVILGAGAAGLTAAESLRQCGFKGAVTVVTRDKHFPYDRTELSKRYLAKPDAKRPYIRSEAFYAQHGIDIRINTPVAEVVAADKRVVCADGDDLGYDALLLATGSRARTLGVDGEALSGVTTLRTLDDCERLRGLAGDADGAVVVGAGFIAMEAAAALIGRGVAVTVVAPEDVPFERVFGERIGRMYQKVHEDKGVAFRLGRTVERFEGNDVLDAVVLDDGERIEANVAVVGVGVTPVTDYLTDIATADDGAVAVGAQLRAGDGVYAAGDIARLPDWRGAGAMRIEHWRMAQQLGRLAAANMTGAEATYDDVPFFWTNQYMVITQYVGHAGRWDEIVFDPAAPGPEQQDFVAYYVADGRVRAAAGCGQDQAMCLIAERLRAGEAPRVEDLQQAVAALSG
ncbi:MAG: FAD-dependent oxidoreductase [Phycisphaerae bacterium]|nr:FAD-dependent oxidoreductase [Phycisphaerae bacterium]